MASCGKSQRSKFPRISYVHKEVGVHKETHERGEGYLPTRRHSLPASRRHPTPTRAARSGIHPTSWNGFSPNFALTFSEVRLSTVLGSPLVGTEKAQILKKVRFGGAPVLDEEYGATVTHKGCDEHSMGAVRRGYSSNNVRAGS